MSSTSSPSRALETILTIIAIGAGGLLLVLVIAVVSGISVGPAPPVDPAMFGLAVGKEAPAIEAPAWINGSPETNAGRPMVVQAWAYDCVYCWQEAPELAALSEQYGDRVSFVALTPDPVDSEVRVREFVEKNNISYPVGYGVDRTLADFKIQAFPSIWLVGSDGTVLWNRSLEGERSLEEAIETALGNEA